MRKVLYRRWRPACFSEVVGQDTAVTALKNQIASGRISHAYIFTGIRGTGKTTLAKILAKAVNCENAKGGEPCCECSICQGIDSGALTDVTEIDAASNTGVDDIRALRDETAFAPAVAKKRVFIIDEVHMLSSSAWAALLKIMENPPEHVMFILATTEIHKVPATILSRCVRFDLARLSPELIVGQLQKIAKVEELTIEPAAARLIARLADGSMRDALSITEACLADNTVSLEAVEKRTVAVDTGSIFQLADFIAQNNPGEAVSLLYELYFAGADASRLCSLLAYHFRTLLMTALRSRSLESELSPDERADYAAQAPQFTIDFLIYAIERLNAAADTISKSPDKRLALESAVIGLCRPQAAEQPVPAQIPKPEQRQPQAAVSAPVGTPNPEPLKSAPSPEPPTERQAPPPTPNAPAVPSGLSPFEGWENFTEGLRGEGMLYGLLADSAAYVDGRYLLIDAGEEFVSCMRNFPEAKDRLKKLLAERAGCTLPIGPYKPAPATRAPLNSTVNDIVKKALELEIPVEIVEE